MSVGNEPIYARQNLGMANQHIHMLSLYYAILLMYFSS